MCTGVSNGLAGVKLSGSLRMYGSFRVSAVRIMRVIMNPRMSFTVKYGWNGILSVFCLILVGYLILFGVGIEGGSILLLRLQMVLGSVVRKIV